MSGPVHPRRRLAPNFFPQGLRLTAAVFACCGLAGAVLAAEPVPRAAIVAPGPLPARVPAPADNPTTAAKVELGKKLFFDPRLSGDNRMSCATCHDPEKAYGDGLARSPGSDGKPLARNTQTALNTGFVAPLFWDGRAATLEEQALKPIESRQEMNQKLDSLEAELRGVPGYVAEFQAVFGRAPDRQGVAQALAAFQRTLVSGPAPFDRYLAGDKQALSAAAQRGWKLFQGEADCVRCHQGPTFSDGKFHRLGIASRDKGRGAVTGQREDDYKFRTPPLRNVAETGPYMHDGSLKTLQDVVIFYLREAPPRGPDGLPLDIGPIQNLSLNDVDDLLAFLRSLSGPLPAVTKPTLP